MALPSISPPANHNSALPPLSARFAGAFALSGWGLRSGFTSCRRKKITDAKAERSLSAFSERARGKQKNTGVEASPDSRPPDTDVVSSLEGPVKIEDDVARTPDITFRVPGAEATLAGTFRFQEEAVHLTGERKMATDISHTATGFKSFLPRPPAPFFKKKNAGALIPIAVTGMPGHYQISQDITHTK